MRSFKESEETVLAGLPVTIVSYKVGSGFVTQIEASEDGCLMARGIAQTSAESLGRALETYSERMRSLRDFELTVGG